MKAQESDFQRITVFFVSVVLPQRNFLGGTFYTSCRKYMVSEILISMFNCEPESFSRETNKLKTAVFSDFEQLSNDPHFLPVIMEQIRF